jgi:hypothetical protein
MARAYSRLRRGARGPLFFMLYARPMTHAWGMWQGLREGFSQKAGIRFGTLGSLESCCGESVKKAGNREVFESLATKQHRSIFREGGIRAIITTSPHCYTPLGGIIRSWGGRLTSSCNPGAGPAHLGDGRLLQWKRSIKKWSTMTPVISADTTAFMMNRAGTSLKHSRS